jgi:hypothetical protein
MVGGMNPRIRSYIVPILAGAALLATAAVALASRAQVNPDPVTFSGASSQVVTISNPGPGDAHWAISLTAGAPHFKLKVPSECSVVPSGQTCGVKVFYAPSGAAEDDGTLHIGDQLQRPNSRDVQLIGHPSAGGGGGGGGNGPNCILHVARNQKLVKKQGRKTVRTPYSVSLTSSEDGTVSARAGGKTKSGKSISLNSVGSPDTAGNGVVMKMKLPPSSENRVRAELAAGRKPKMTLRGQCQGQNGTTVETAVIHFKKGKRGNGFTLPLIADAKAR